MLNTLAMYCRGWTLTNYYTLSGNTLLLSAHHKEAGISAYLGAYSVGMPAFQTRMVQPPELAGLLA
jgi:hypothetical protein